MDFGLLCSISLCSNFGIWVWILDFGFCILDFGFRILDFEALCRLCSKFFLCRFWILDFGFNLDFGFMISDFGFRILDFEFWILDAT